MAETILAIAEQRQGKLNRASLETLVAAQQLAEARGAKLIVALPGKSVTAPAEEFAAKKLDELYEVEHDLLEPYTPDAFAVALRQLIEQLQPALVLFPHTYQVRDFAPKLAAGFKRSLISDCIGLGGDAKQTVFVR
ncbi:MAG: electron transfer flavoprotein subunit alpha/FixB family protein, partial [Candidatus Acidiferrales bacterium]